MPVSSSRHFSASLAIDRLPEPRSALRCGSVYWLSCDRTLDRNTLCTQVIMALPASMQVTLIADCTLATQVSGLFLQQDNNEGHGPAAIHWYELPEELSRPALQGIIRDLGRLRQAGQLVILALPVAVMQSFPDRILTQWCQQLARQAGQLDIALLVMAEGLSSALGGRLYALDRFICGLAQLYYSQGDIRLLQRFWINTSGVAGAADFQLYRHESGFSLGLQPEHLLTDETGDDQHFYLAQTSVLEQAPAPSGYWELFDEPEALHTRAMAAHAATVLLAIDDSTRINELARQLYGLRQHCGDALRLVIREMRPVLRYKDDQLLLACGASLIVPFGNNLTRFLTLVEMVRGQRWQRTLPDDLDTFISHMQPVPLSGLLSPRQFSGAVQTMWRGVEHGEIDHRLLCLYPVSGLSPAQAMTQSHLRRHGDIACIVNGALFLFLFACRQDGLERALENIFRLPWRELFSGYETFDMPDILDEPAFQDEQVPPAAISPLPAAAEEPPAREPLTPHRAMLPPGHPA